MARVVMLCLMFLHSKVLFLFVLLLFSVVSFPPFFFVIMAKVNDAIIFNERQINESWNSADFVYFSFFKEGKKKKRILKVEHNGIFCHVNLSNGMNIKHYT